jgi:hypothetical protein
MKIAPYVLTKKLHKPTNEEWSEFTHRFGAPLPTYREFMNTLGDGRYSNAVRVYSLNKILAEINEFRERWQDYFLWDGEESALAKEDLVDAVVLGDSLDGDEIITVPAKEGVFVLHRHRDVAVRVGNDIDDAIIYICDSGAIYNDINFHYFEGSVDRCRKKYLLVDGVFDFDVAHRAILELEHVRCETTREEDYVSIISPPIQGSVSLIGSQAVLTHDVDCDISAAHNLLMRLGYMLQ